MDIDAGGAILEDSEQTQRRLDAATHEIKELRVESQRQQKVVSDEQTEARLQYEVLSREQADRHDELTKKLESDRREHELKSREIEKERGQADRAQLEAHAQHLREQSDAKRQIE